MKPTNNKAIFLARWYPSKYNPMLGLFIQRHAEAANKCCDVGVVYAHIIEDADAKVNSKYKVDFNVEHGVPTARVYYEPSKIKVEIIRKIIENFRYYNANIIGLRLIKKELGGFNIIHVHVLTRLGIIALYYSLFFGKPYIITEHWSRYLDITGTFNGYWRKLITKIIVRYASCVTVVTNNLANAMQSYKLLNKNYIILPNVVDTMFINKDNTYNLSDKGVKFVHVSCFEDKSKNVSGLLRVIRKLSDLRNDFVFQLIGDGVDFNWLRDYATELNLTDNEVVFTGLLEGDELVKQMSDSDMLVVFSNYENFPVVINESLALGVPVLATKVGGISERISTENGMLVNAGDEEQLLSALVTFLDKKKIFDAQQIQQKAIKEFSAENVGNIICGLYDEAIAKTHKKK